MRTHLVAALLGAVLAAPASAAVVVIDFDALDSSSTQPVPLTSFSEDGYTFGLTYSPVRRSGGPAIFDTTCTGYGGADGCNGDIDLVPGIPDLTGGVQGQNGISGNVLILQENAGGAPTPNDDAQEGTITFTVLSGKAFRLKGFSAVDNGTFRMSTAADGLLGTIRNTAENQTGAARFSSSWLRVGDSFKVQNVNSGGTDSFILAQVPVPAALPVLVGGLGLLAWVARRRGAA
jgi:hypothetical protein